jgi:hypothetical protein
MGSRYVSSDIELVTSELRSMRYEGLHSNEDMLENLDYLHTTLQNKNIKIPKEERVMAIYTVAVHDPYNEKYARLLGKIMEPSRHYHREIAEAIVLGRKATQDNGVDPDGSIENVSPLQRIVTNKVEKFLSEGAMSEKRVKQFLGEVPLAGERLKAPVTDGFMQHLGALHNERMAKQSNNFSDVFSAYMHTAMEFLSITTNGLTEKGQKLKKEATQQLRNVL